MSAELVDVGAGTAPTDYAGKTIAGRIVLADGPLPAVHRLACEERKAAGFLSAFPNQTTAWSGDDRDLVPLGTPLAVSPDNRFAFMVSKRQAEEFRRRLAAGERIVLRADGPAKMNPATFDVVSATIRARIGPPRGRPDGASVHQSAGANDNALGQRRAVRDREGSPERRGRGWERLAGRSDFSGCRRSRARSLARSVTPRCGPSLVAGIPGHGGEDALDDGGTLHVSRSAESLPHAVDEIAARFLDHGAGSSAVPSRARR